MNSKIGIEAYSVAAVNFGCAAYYVGGAFPSNPGPVILFSRFPESS
jgi:hypothetical protein